MLAGGLSENGWSARQPASCVHPRPPGSADGLRSIGQEIENEGRTPDLLLLWSTHHANDRFSENLNSVPGVMMSGLSRDLRVLIAVMDRPVCRHSHNLDRHVVAGAQRESLRDDARRTVGWALSAARWR